MTEKEALKRFISELKANLEEIEHTVVVQIRDDLENVRASGGKSYECVSFYRSA